jgi:hypothetical protein
MRTLIVVAALALALSCYGAASISDRALVAEFRSHRAEFEQLATLAREDRQLWRVSHDWYRSATGTNYREPQPNLLSAGRWTEYRRLFRILRLDTGVNIAPGSVAFARRSSGLSVSGSTKGLMWLQDPPDEHSVCTTLDSMPSHAQSSGICFRPIEGHWYIYLDWT